MTDQETIETLESVGTAYKNVWLKQTFKDFIVSIGIIIISVLCLILAVYKIRENNTGSAVGNLIKAPLTGLTVFFAVAFVVGFFIGIAFLRLSIRRLRRGPPKAGTSPEQTIRMYFANCLLSRMRIKENNIQIDAFVCLLNSAKEAIGGWERFTTYWVNINYDIIRYLESKFRPDAITDTSLAVENIEIKERVDDSCVATFTVRIGATSGITSPGVSKAKILPMTRFSQQVELVLVGERWYFRDPFWRGVEVSEAAVEAARPS